MKSSPYRILIVDDHPIICDGYQLFLSNLAENQEGFSFKTVSTNTYEDALSQVLDSMEQNRPFDLILLDIQLNSENDGESLGKLIRSNSPGSKILVLTYLSNNYKLHSILTSISPEGFLIKSEADELEFRRAVINVLSGRIYHGPVIATYFQNERQLDDGIDNVDRKLIYFLEKGFATSALPDKLHLSQSAVEKRKRKIADFFNLEVASTKEILMAARIRNLV